MSDDLLARTAATAAVREAREWLAARRERESVPIDRAGGRTLAAPVEADAAIPPHDISTMDGYAVAAGDGYPLSVVGEEAYPGDDPPPLGEDEAVRVATGGPLPDRADAVVMVEDAAVTDDRLEGPSLSPGTNVYRQGTNVRAGETLYPAGEALTPIDATLLRDVGVDAVPVLQRLSVGVLGTGTEIYEGTAPDRDSETLAGLARSWGATASIADPVPDDPGAIEAAVDRLAADADVVVTSGGTSVGGRDHIGDVLSRLGEVVFHGVRLRPGKPVALARLSDHDAVVVAVPGKPVSAAFAALFVARPLFAADPARPLPTLSARSAVDMELPGGDMEYAVPVLLSAAGDGDGRTATPLGHEDSPLPLFGDRFRPGRLAASTRAVRADGFVLASADLTAGDPLEIVPVEALTCP